MQVAIGDRDGLCAWLPGDCSEPCVGRLRDARQLLTCSGLGVNQLDIGREGVSPQRLVIEECGLAIGRENKIWVGKAGES